MLTKVIKVCLARKCNSRFSSHILTRLEQDHTFYGYPESIQIEKCHCQNKCENGPIVIFDGEIGTSENPIKASETLHRKVEEWRKQHQI